MAIDVPSPPSPRPLWALQAGQGQAPRVGDVILARLDADPAAHWLVKEPIGWVQVTATGAAECLALAADRPDSLSFASYHRRHVDAARYAAAQQTVTAIGRRFPTPLRTPSHHP
jgi:hypothetical protein